MRVLAMFHAYPPTHNAGAEWMAHTMLHHLVRQGAEVHVCLSAPTDGVDYAFQGVSVHARRDKGDPIRLIGVHRPDVIVTHLENTARASVLALQFGLPVVHLLHNTFWPTKVWASRYPVSLLVANSQWMRGDFAAHFANMNRPMPPTVVIRPPVLAEDYRTKPGDRVTLVNLYANKGAATFWELAGRMADVKFLAVRGGYGPQEIPDQLPANVDLVDNTPNMRDEVYARTKVLLMPSEYESWGRVGVEAMCSGIPVIAHPAAGLLESLGAAGTFVDRENIDGWVTALRTLLKPAKWRTASRAAAARAAELDPATDLQRWQTAIDTLAARRPARGAI